MANRYDPNPKRIPIVERGIRPNEPISMQMLEDRMEGKDVNLEAERLRAILRRCMPGANPVDLGDGEIVGLYQRESDDA